MGRSQESPMFKPRAVPRARVSIPARYQSPELQLEGRVTDLSTEGCFFSAQFLDIRGERVEINLVLPAPEGPLRLRAEVRWVRDTPLGGGMGLQLVDLAQGDRARLAALLASAAAGSQLDVVPLTA